MKPCYKTFNQLQMMSSHSRGPPYQFILKSVKFCWNICE
jgi:hypothetical protein